jgi:hypothetical protein
MKLMSTSHIGYESVLAPDEQASLSHMGNDVWLSTFKNNKPMITINARPYHRLLDHLYIPGKTTELTRKQIITINRFRERTISADPQYGYRNTIRDLFGAALESIKFARVLEIGPGRYPLPLPESVTYSAVEIDPLSVEYLRSIGVAVIDSVGPRNYFDVCVGLFVFHFDVGWHTLDLLFNSMADDGVILFNVVSSITDVRTLAFSRLSRLGFWGTCIDLLPSYKKNDVIFICSKDGPKPKGLQLYNAMLAQTKGGHSDGRTFSVLGKSF